MNRLFLLLCITAFAFAQPAFADEANAGMDATQTVVKMSLEDGVSPEDAIDSMKLRANLLNMMFVSHQPLSDQLKSMRSAGADIDYDIRRLEIFQFCDPVIAGRMVLFNSMFAAYMPCRIALVEEADGSAALTMMNLEMLIQGTELPGELLNLAEDVNSKLLEIMEAGATGAF